MPTIHTIDLHYLGIPYAIAAFVIIAPGGAVLIETGPASTLPALERGLAGLGLACHDIRHVLVTHIHLDHAGAAGHLALAGAEVWVHEFGAPHLADPTRLIRSAGRIYRDQMSRLWGPILPTAPDRLHAVADGDVIDVCGLRFVAIATPGHARHHHAYALDGICFVGDVAGIVVPGVPEAPEGKFLVVPSPPPEFDPVAWQESLNRLRARRFSEIHLTHFGKRVAVEAHLDRVEQALLETTRWTEEAWRAGSDRDDMLRSYTQKQRAAAKAEGLSAEQFEAYVSRNLRSMNVEGIIRYLEQSHAPPKHDCT